MPAAAWKITADVERYDEAVDWFLKRTVITAEDARARDDERKADAFWIGGSLQLDQIQRVFDKIAIAIEKGTTLDDFKKAVKTELRDPVHVETVFRNAVQRSYNAGRWFQMREPGTLRFRPYWLFDAILDSRTTVVCRVCNQTILPAEDVFWLSHVCPMHHRCRSSIRNLTREQRDRFATDPNYKIIAPEHDPTPGWGQPPTAQSWRPSKNRYEHQLELDFEKRAKRGERKRKPRPAKEHEPEHWEPLYRDRYGDAAPALAHGRASLERGLDLSVADARKLLRQVKAPGVDAMHDALEDADPKRTLREQAGELDPMRKAAAALAGHLQLVPKRGTELSHPQLTGPDERKTLAFLNRLTDASVAHPGSAYTFRRAQLFGRAYHSAAQRLIVYTDSEGVLAHEWAHALETLNARLSLRAEAFLAARTKYEPLVDHGENGECREDQFIYFYVGRDYDFAGKLLGTEITSMGIELLFAGRRFWGSLSELLQKDPEHFLFLLGQLANR